MDITRFATVQQDHRHPSRTSKAYRFVSTKEILARFAEYGWEPSQVQEASVRKPENHGFQRHLIRLENPAYDRHTIGVGDAYPQVVLKNAHNGESSVHLYAGIFEKVCSNGLVLWRGELDHFRIAHRHVTAETVNAAILHLTNLLPAAFVERERWRQTFLRKDERLAFAEAAASLRFHEKAEVDPTHLLQPRRTAQADFTLWNVLNNVQEHLIRGGIVQRHPDGTRVRSRAIKSVDEDVRLNRELWRLAEALEKAIN